MNPILLTPLDISIAASLIILDAALSIVLKLRLHRQIAIAATRMVVQLVAIGYVLRFANGFTIYNAGDTAVTMDMKIVHDLYKPNLVILPIGDFYTMGAEQAAYALNLLKPQFAIGGHWGTWNGMPPGTPEALEKELAHYKIPTQLIKLKPGETFT